MTDHDIHAATVALASDLLARRSLTPDDAGCLDLIASRLAPLGFVCDWVTRGGVRNLWARRGTAQPLVCVAGHVDVVPPGPLGEWTSDPFTPTERDGYLYARGAADMKGALAAAITAVERVVTAHPDAAGSVAVLATADEEGAGVDGTAAVVDWLASRGERIDQCIVVEPTSSSRLGDVVKNGRRGSLNGTLTVRGVQCHIAYPQLGRNPIHEVAPALAALATATWDDGNEYFPPTTFQVSNIHAGTGANNVVPGSLTLLFNFRFSTASTVEGLQARVHEILGRHGLDYAIDWSLSGRPFLTPRGALTEALADVVASVTGGAPPTLSTTGGTSDARFLAAVADEVVEFGPVNESMHKVDERVRLADLAPLSRIYETLLGRLLGVGGPAGV